jgi:hypothetical protein
MSSWKRSLIELTKTPGPAPSQRDLQALRPQEQVETLFAWVARNVAPALDVSLGVATRTPRRHLLTTRSPGSTSPRSTRCDCGQPWREVRVGFGRTCTPSHGQQQSEHMCALLPGRADVGLRGADRPPGVGPVGHAARMVAGSLPRAERVSRFRERKLIPGGRCRNGEPISAHRWEAGAVRLRQSDAPVQVGASSHDSGARGAADPAPPSRA